MTDSPELRELKKQTAMMARERAAKGAAAALVLGTLGVAWFMGGDPAPYPFWWPLAIGAAFAALVYGLTIKRER